MFFELKKEKTFNFKKRKRRQKEENNYTRRNIHTKRCKTKIVYNNKNELTWDYANKYQPSLTFGNE